MYLSNETMQIYYAEKSKKVKNELTEMKTCVIIHTDQWLV